MPRNAEVIRQWKILRTLDASRQGETIAGLARQCEVTTPDDSGATLSPYRTSASL